MLHWVKVGYELYEAISVMIMQPCANTPRFVLQTLGETLVSHCQRGLTT